jgi:hypothetical protein
VNEYTRSGPDDVVHELELSFVMPKVVSDAVAVPPKKLSGVGPAQVSPLPAAVESDAESVNAPGLPMPDTESTHR